MNDAYEPDPIVVDAVASVRDRFGAQGLSELIALAQQELIAAEAALRELSDDQTS